MAKVNIHTVPHRDDGPTPARGQQARLERSSRPKRRLKPRGAGPRCARRLSTSLERATGRSPSATAMAAAPRAVKDRRQGCVAAG